MKKIDALVKFMAKNPMISAYNGNKDEYKRLAMAALKELCAAVAADILERTGLQCQKTIVTFNPAGPAVGGDPRAFLMLNDGLGIYIAISDSFGSYWRTVKHIKDYMGGANRDLYLDHEDTVQQMARVLIS